MSFFLAGTEDCSIYIFFAICLSFGPVIVCHFFGGGHVVHHFWNMFVSSLKHVCDAFFCNFGVIFVVIVVSCFVIFWGVVYTVCFERAVKGGQEGRGRGKREGQGWRNLNLPKKLAPRPGSSHFRVMLNHFESFLCHWFFKICLSFLNHFRNFSQKIGHVQMISAQNKWHSNDNIWHKYDMPH